MNRQIIKHYGTPKHCHSQLLERFSLANKMKNIMIQD